jgi:hypothetical protein
VYVNGMDTTGYQKKNRIKNMVTSHPCYDGQINPD